MTRLVLMVVGFLVGLLVRSRLRGRSQEMSGSQSSLRDERRPPAVSSTNIQSDDQQSNDIEIEVDFLSVGGPPTRAPAIRAATTPSEVVRNLTVWLAPFLGLIALVLWSSRATAPAAQPTSFRGGYQRAAGITLRGQLAGATDQTQTFPRQLDLRFSTIEIDRGPDNSQYDTACLGGLTVVTYLPLSPTQESARAEHLNPAAQECVRVSDARATVFPAITTHERLEFSLPGADTGDYYLYPWDRSELDMDVVASVQYQHSDGAPGQVVHELTKQVVELAVPRYVFEPCSGNNCIDGSVIDLVRPSSLGFAAIVLVAALFAMVLLIQLASSFGVAIQVAVAVGIGVLAIRSGVVPSDSPGVTLLDAILLGNYGLLVGALLLHRLVRPRPPRRLHTGIGVAAVGLIVALWVVGARTNWYRVDPPRFVDQANHCYQDDTLIPSEADIDRQPLTPDGMDVHAYTVVIGDVSFTRSGSQKMQLFVSGHDRSVGSVVIVGAEGTITGDYGATVIRAKGALGHNFTECQAELLARQQIAQLVDEPGCSVPCVGIDLRRVPGSPGPSNT